MSMWPDEVLSVSPLSWMVTATYYCHLLLLPPTSS